MEQLRIDDNLSFLSVFRATRTAGQTRQEGQKGRHWRTRWSCKYPSAWTRPLIPISRKLTLPWNWPKIIFHFPDECFLLWFYFNVVDGGGGFLFYRVPLVRWARTAFRYIITLSHFQCRLQTLPVISILPFQLRWIFFFFLPHFYSGSQLFLLHRNASSTFHAHSLPHSSGGTTACKSCAKMDNNKIIRS